MYKQRYRQGYKQQSSPTILLSRVREAVITRWIESRGWYMVKDCFVTTDSRIAGTGYSPYRVFPYNEPFLKYLWARMWQYKRLALVKFRQGMATNLIAAARNLVLSLLFEGSQNFILKRTFEEADHILKYRVMELWRNIPHRVKVPIDGKIVEVEPKEILPVPEFKEGVVTIRRPRPYGDPLASSTIEALQGVVEKARGLTGFNAVIDEAAFTEQLRDTYTAMSPAMQYIQLISSPKPGEFQQCFTIGLTTRRF